VAQAEAIIDPVCRVSCHWMDKRGTVPLILQLNAQADEWRAWNWHGRASCWPRRERRCRAGALSKGLTQKMLHGAMAELHAGDADPRAGHSAIQHSSCAKSVATRPLGVPALL